MGQYGTYNVYNISVNIVGFVLNIQCEFVRQTGKGLEINCYF